MSKFDDIPGAKDQLNPLFSELAMTALEEDIDMLEESLISCVDRAVYDEGSGVVKDWLEFILQLINESPKATSNRKQLILEICENIRRNI